MLVLGQTRRISRERLDPKPFVFQRLVRRQPFARIQHQQLIDQIGTSRSSVYNPRKMVLDLPRMVAKRVLSGNLRVRIWPSHGIGVFDTWQAGPAGEIGLVGRSTELCDELQLVQFGCSLEQRSTRDHLRQDTAYPPHVDRRTVLFLAR